MCAYPWRTKTRAGAGVEMKALESNGAQNSVAYYRLVGTHGAAAVVGEAVKIENDQICWKLDPGYASWLWPLMTRLATLVILMPAAHLEPAESDDCTAAPGPPTEAQKNTILQMPERPQDLARVYTLVIKGKPPSVHKACPTRTANLNALHYRRAKLTGKRKRI